INVPDCECPIFNNCRHVLQKKRRGIIVCSFLILDEYVIFVKVQTYFPQNRSRQEAVINFN
ncbi:MAG: hypothetical protein LBT89_11145, partial [Planctomycetaceae bacterium]|nr:hypothetical protein [Planctomycetaceae bacterium]